ncbi:lysylphosphatidylglycerol synthase transmembrane domain-containing protein [Cellulomonas sp. RIT-PI-Y]|uniref:lysylphosphatidylglycerol synthase transmembrane domain-containing protein n=1 Tax=Cellulomonas sp. RIT-PI-Y TaxID=3035297 RepID=UPI0021D9A674|nr:lysylphosphatidylglycerol synthase transmembrane domain-containing protein [Cellulomonas sp. RIT-PI-Y]
MSDAPTSAPAAPGRSDGEAAPASHTRIVDTPENRVHHPSDLLGVVLSLVGAVLVMVLATYAHNTTSGVAEDVEGVASLLQDLLVVPTALLESVVTFFVPTAVLIELAFRRLGRQMLEGVAAAVASVLASSTVLWLVEHLGSDELVAGLSVRLGGTWTVTVPGYIALIAGLLTATGPRTRRRTVLWSWNLVWVAIGIMVITGSVSITGIGLSLLIGRAGGLATRYVSGVRSERAYGSSLVAGIRRAGFDPELLVRVPDAVPTDDSPVPDDEPGTPAARGMARYSDHRVYEMTTVTGSQYDVLIYDGDRQVIGFLSRLWRSIRLRGLDGRSTVSLRQAAERSALLSYTASAAGVRAPQLHAVSEADASMILVQDRVADAVPLADLDPDAIDDEALRAIWAQLGTAHEAGLAHRALTSDVVLLGRDADGAPQVWLIGWEQGDVASSELAQRMDRTQMVALLALRVGPARALESAVAVLDEGDIAAIGPLLQTVALPQRTREELRAHKQVLAELRSALVARLPQADVEPVALNRFGARTLITILLTVAAVIVLLTTINLQTILDALAETDWRLSLLAFAFGMSTLFGAALTLVAFAPQKIPLWRATVTQSAATFVALAAPAGIGPAALNLRLLTKRGVSGALATATVALVQVSQFVVTLLMLLVLSVASGTNQLERFTISPTVVLAIGILVGLIAALMLVPRVRQWVAAKTVPTLQQTWPRLIEVVGQPSRLLLGIAGNALTTLGYVLAFEVCLRAFGQNLSLVQVAIVFLVGNTAGSVAPTPGGVGTTELALGGALAVVGVNPGVATSVAVLFRVLTYWLRIPVGWAAMRYLRKVGEL